MVTILSDNKDTLSIRLLEKRDLESARTLHNDHDTLLNLYDINHVSELNQQAWFEKISQASKCLRYSIFKNDCKELLGIFKIDHIDHINKSVCFGLDIAVKFRGNGYAKNIYKYFMDFYFLNLYMHRIYLSVIDCNDIAKNLYTSLGFVEEGRMREALYRNGQFNDLIYMSILKQEYLSSKNSIN